MIVAVGIDEVPVCRMEIKTKRTMTGEDAEAQAGSTRRPYAVAEHVFGEYDLEACTLTLLRIAEIRFLRQVSVNFRRGSGQRDAKEISRDRFTKTQQKGESALA